VNLNRQEHPGFITLRCSLAGVLRLTLKIDIEDYKQYNVREWLVLNKYFEVNHGKQRYWNPDQRKVS
jgi:hypothetical protein